MPLSAAAGAALAADPALLDAVLTGGDDYELLFAAAPGAAARIAAAGAAAGVAGHAHRPLRRGAGGGAGARRRRRGASARPRRVEPFLSGPAGDAARRAGDPGPPSRGRSASPRGWPEVGRPRAGPRRVAPGGRACARMRGRACAPDRGQGRAPRIRGRTGVRPG